MRYKVIRQMWICDAKPAGCSLHVSQRAREAFVSEHKRMRSEEVFNLLGIPDHVWVDETLYSMIMRSPNGIWSATTVYPTD